MKMLGRLIGSGYCTCRDCGRPAVRQERRRLKRRERRAVREQIARRTG